MKAYVTVERTLTLTLTDAERQWLQALMQNPIAPLSVVEHPDDAEMRKKFFEATTLPTDL